jgi:methyl-accepting chemotaxis protein
MRIKIVAVNALIVFIVSVLSFLLVRSALATATGNKDQLASEAQNDVNGAAGSLQLDGLRAERWLAGAALESATVDALTKATQEARGDAATKRCDDLVSRMKNAPLFERNVPTLVALVDVAGHIVGRNNSNLSRGDDLAGMYAGLKSTLASGQSGSDIWYERDRYLASYVAVRDEQAKIIGGLVIGRPLNDTLSRASEEATGRALVLVVPKGDGFDVVAHSAQQLSLLDAGVQNAAKDALKNALAHQHTDVVRDGDLLIAASPLAAFENGRRALLVAAAPASLIADPNGFLLLPILGAFAIGILLVIVAGWQLGTYITRPINMLEEGLLGILNGQSDKRFELDHAELGGLAFRIDQLLNQLMGVEEDTTDSEGRVSSVSQNPSTFTDALEADDKKAGATAEGIDAAAVERLAAEPSGQYYARIYREYVAAKQAIGESTDHISEVAFATRIRNMEEDQAQKYGRPVRYQVRARNREVVLLAVPLP